MFSQLKQFVSEEFCLKCDVCCRFIDNKSNWVPVFTPQEIKGIINIKKAPSSLFSEDNKIRLKPHKDTYICPFFCVRDNKCIIYTIRPFDCQLYPFILIRDESRIFLGADKKCHFIKDKIQSKDFKKYTGYLIDFLSSQEMIKFICDNPCLVCQLKDDVISIAPLILVSKKLDESKKIRTQR